MAGPVACGSSLSDYVSKFSSFDHESLGCLLEVSNEISTFLGVGDTSKGHSVTGCVVGGGLEVLIEVIVGPLLVLDTLEGTGVNEAFLGCGG